jgi:hypothetical protein
MLYRPIPDRLSQTSVKSLSYETVRQLSDCLDPKALLSTGIAQTKVDSLKRRLNEYGPEFVIMGQVVCTFCSPSHVYLCFSYATKFSLADNL